MGDDSYDSYEVVDEVDDPTTVYHDSYNSQADSGDSYGVEEYDFNPGKRKKDKNGEIPFGDIRINFEHGIAYIPGEKECSIQFSFSTEDNGTNKLVIDQFLCRRRGKKLLLGLLNAFDDDDIKKPGKIKQFNEVELTPTDYDPNIFTPDLFYKSINELQTAQYFDEMINEKYFEKNTKTKKMNLQQIMNLQQNIMIW